MIVPLSMVIYLLNGDYPAINGDLPMKNGDLPIKWWFTHEKLWFTQFTHSWITGGQ